MDILVDERGTLTMRNDLCTWLAPSNYVMRTVSTKPDEADGKRFHRLGRMRRTIRWTVTINALNHLLRIISLLPYHERLRFSPFDWFHFERKNRKIGSSHVTSMHFWHSSQLFQYSNFIYFMTEKSKHS